MVEKGPNFQWLEPTAHKPRSSMRTDVSRSLTNSPHFTGIFAGSNA
jgi:hypothetical protein